MDEGRTAALTYSTALMWHINVAATKNGGPNSHTPTGCFKDKKGSKKEMLVTNG